MTVLLIDQDTRFRRSLAAMLRADGCVVQEYTHARELPPLDTAGEFSLVIVDNTTNEHNGLVFADEFHQVHPTTPILLLTAYWSLYLAGEVARRDFIHLRRKPIGCPEVKGLVHYLGQQTTSSRLRSTAGAVNRQGFVR